MAVKLDFCQICGLKLVTKYGFPVCPKHFADFKGKPPRVRIKKYSGRMGEKQRALLNGRD